MGAHDYIISYKEADQSKVRKLWDRQVEEDEYDSGRGAYAGNATTMNGPIQFRDTKLASENDARRWILDEHNKRDAPIGASFYLPVEKTERDKKREEKADQTYDWLWEKATAIVAKANDALRNRKSKTIGCSHCGSKLSKEAYLKTVTTCDILRGRKGALRTFGCSVCKESLISKTVMDRAKAYEAKLDAADKACKEARKPKPGKKIGWCVGGWAAS